MTVQKQFLNASSTTGKTKLKKILRIREFLTIQQISGADERKRKTYVGERIFYILNKKQGCRFFFYKSINIVVIVVDIFEKKNIFRYIQ